MSKEFIPYEEALALKDLGFDEDCLGTYYEEDKSFYMNGVSYSNSYFTKAQEVITEHPLITTPLYQQAFRWFREKYSIDKTIITRYHYKTGIKSYRVGIVFINDENKIDSLFIKDENKVSFIEHKTYEEAELACLRKLIELIK